MNDGEAGEAAAFFEKAIQDIGGLYGSSIKTLDFGCGSGKMVDHVVARGFEAFGCDVQPFWEGVSDPARFHVISEKPYRLPFEAEAFDVVVSTSVFEHVQDKQVAFQELHRVLRAGGWSMHLLPSKWYLPVEPHLNVPLVNYLWPRCPRWWLALWAMMGVRNQFQREKSWREVLDLNAEY